MVRQRRSDSVMLQQGQKRNKTANINVKKLQFIHKLTSKTATITKNDIIQQHIDI